MLVYPGTFLNSLLRIAKGYSIADDRLIFFDILEGYLMSLRNEISRYYSLPDISTFLKVSDCDCDIIRILDSDCKSFFHFPSYFKTKDRAVQPDPGRYDL